MVELEPLVEEWDSDLASADPLVFPGYAEKLAEAQRAGESVRTGRTRHHVLIEGRFHVLGGSMGVVHGEKVVRAFDRAVSERLPVVVVTQSGGARMQEGMVSLVQMARTAAAARRHAEAGLLSVAVHRSPTTGGVFASYGSLCSVSAVEEGAVIGFAGPRVVEQTVGVSVEGRSHSAATAYEQGLVDAVLGPDEVRSWVDAALGLVDRPLPSPLRVVPDDPCPDEPGAWGEVLRARWRGRPSGVDLAAALCRSWVDLHGPDPVVRAGLVSLGDGSDGGGDSDAEQLNRAVVVALDRYAGDGRPTPDGYRLAQRAIALAGRLGLPLVTLIDTPGAEPGPEAEADGVAGQIAATFSAMAALPTVSVAVCVGEGGSGGALALAAADRLFLQEHAVFSVIGPEGAAAILERDASKASQMAPHLKLTSADVVALGVADGVVADDVAGVVRAVRAALVDARPSDRERRFDAASARWLAAEQQ